MKFKLLLSLFVISLGASVYSKEVPMGYVFGTWKKADSPIYVNGDITIPHGQTLVIEAGVDILFRGNYQIDVHGSIIAEGTYNNKIVFGQEGTSSWKGIRYDKTHNGNAESVFRYCIIQKARNNDLNAGKGGAFYVNAFHNICIINSIIKNNYAANEGGGIFLQNSNIKVVNCIISRNQANEGGGFYIKNSRPLIINCNVVGNRLTYIENLGSGIYNNNSHVQFLNNLVFDNDVFNVGDHLSLIDNELDFNPGFIDYADDNYRLRDDAYAINRGIRYPEVSEFLDDTDIYGNPRFYYSGRIDLGAAENQSVIFNETPVIESIPDQFISAGNKVALTVTAKLGSISDQEESYNSVFTITSDKPEVTIQYLTDNLNTNSVEFEISVQANWVGVATISVNIDDNTEASNSKALMQFDVIADAEKADEITIDETWEGEIVISKNTTIASGVNVTINPGTKVFFSDNYSITVHGQLLVQGDFENRSYFASTNGNANGWGTIRVTSNGSAQFNYTNFKGSKNSRYCLDVINTTFNGCLFEDNSNHNGLIYCGLNVSVFNSVFNNNRQTSNSGWLFRLSSSTNYLSNIVVYNCNYGSLQAGSLGQIMNAVIWGNKFSTPIRTGGSQNIVYRNSIIQNVVKEHSVSSYGETIWDIDPQFTNPANGDFSFLPNSPGINNGYLDPENNNHLFDFNGGGRIQGTLIDIGAVEHNGAAQVESFITIPASKIDFGFTSPEKPVMLDVYFYNSGATEASLSIELDQSSPFEIKTNGSWAKGGADVLIGSNSSVGVSVRLTSSEEGDVSELLKLSSQNASLSQSNIHLIGKVTKDVIIGDRIAGSDTIKGDITWCAEEIRIKSDIVIDSEATLTICAGTKVLFDGDYRLRVNGRLVLNGTETETIVFTSDGNVWHSILISNGLTKDINTFANFVIDNASLGLLIISGDVKIENAIIKNASQAINFSNNKISEPSEINRSKIVNNRYGIIFWYGNNPAKIENTLLANNLDAVTYHLYSANEEQDAYLFCTFSDNTRHITTTGAYHGVSSINNSLFYKGDLPYLFDELSTWGHNFRDFSDGNPRMVKSGDFEYRFNSNSPCFNAGDPSVNAGDKDIEGNPRVFDAIPDIGAFEYSNRETIANEIEIEDIELYAGFNEYILDIPAPYSSWWNNVEVILIEENDILTANYGSNAIELVEGNRAGKTKVTLSSHPDNSSFLFECSFYVTIKEKTGFSATIEDVVLNEGFGEHLIDVSQILTYEDMQKANISVQTDSPHMLKVDFKQARETLRFTERGTGKSQILLRATINGESIFQSFHVHVLEAENSAPQVVSPITDKIFGEGFCSASINIRNVFVDEDPEDYLVYEVYSQNESIVQVFENNGQLFILEKGLGDTNIVLLATDSKGAIAENAFNISIIEGNGSISGIVTANQSFPQLSIGLTQQSASKSANTQGIRVLLIQEQTNLEIQRSVTNSEGEFIFSNIPYGDYYIGFDLPGFTVIDTYYLTISATELQITDLKYGVNFNSETITDVPELFEKAAIQIYPNPTKGKVNIEIDRAVTAGSIKLYNTHGSMLREDNLKNLPNGYLHNWNLSDLPPAIYWISVELDGTEYTEKIVLQ